MWKQTLKEVFKFLFENPVVFLIILANYALLFLLAPLIGVVAVWFISTFYLVGIHGSLQNLWEDLKRFAKWGFVVAVVLYALYFLTGLVSYFVYTYLVSKFQLSFGALMAFTVVYSLLLAALIHAVYLPLFASTDFKSFKENLKRVKLLFSTRGGIAALVLLWGFMFLTLLAGLIKFFRATVGLYAVIATFWLTYYTFLGVKVLKNRGSEEG
ncbi:MAG: hypothetical protein GXO08_02485 [Aquificae bacterium]|nr:hypothetical protein [Aquificota bacterium]